MLRELLALGAVLVTVPAVAQVEQSTTAIADAGAPTIAVVECTVSVPTARP